jgi:hypothetical protein
MADDSPTIELSRSELREVAGYAAACARPALAIFERERPGDRRGDDPAAGAEHIARSRTLAPPVVVDVLRRYPAAPPGGGRVGELIRRLDASLR